MRFLFEGRVLWSRLSIKALEKTQEAMQEVEEGLIQTSSGKK